MISGALSKWDRFWFSPGSPRTLARFRVGFGLFMLVYWLRLLPDVSHLLCVDGFYLPWADSPQGPIQSTDDLIGFFVGSPSRTQAWTCYLAMLVALLGFIIGFWFRLSAVVYLTLQTYHYFAYNHGLQASFDNEMIIVTFVLLLSPCGEDLSWDAFTERIGGVAPPEEVCLWTQRLLCVQLSIWYFGVGVHKILNDAWDSGDIVYTSLLGPWGTPFGLWLAGLGLPMGVWDLTALLVIIFQLFAAFLLFSRQWQIPTMIIGAAFHLLNWLLFGIWQFLFFPLMYILYFDPIKIASHPVVARQAASLLDQSSRDTSDRQDVSPQSKGKT
jgi:hypothetical protein